MKILLLQPASNWHHPYAETPSLALLSLGTLAKREGHKVRVYHLDIDSIDLKEELTKWQPDIVGITCNTFQVKSAREIAQTVRRVSPSIKVMVGGPHAIAWDGEADKVVVGEGENQWLEIIAGKPLANFEELYPLDYGLVDMRRFSGVSPMGAVPSMVVFGSRGCPYQCIFCNTPVFWGSKVRYRSPENILEEVEFLHKRYGIQEVFFQDDTFNANHKWAGAIFDGLIARGLSKEMVFRIDCRVNEKLLTEDFVKHAQAAGVWNMFFGLESGSQKVLDACHKGIKVEEIRRAIRLTKQYGIKAQCSFIVGLPGESHETLTETQALIADIKPWMIGWGYATPFPATQYTKWVTGKGYRLHVDYANYVYGKLMVRTDDLTHDALAAFPGFKN